MAKADAEVADAVDFASHAEAPPVERAFADVYGGTAGRVSCARSKPR